MGSELGHAAGAVEQMQQSIWHPLISSNSSVFQFVPNTAPTIPAALEQQPSAVATSHFSARDPLASCVPDHKLNVAI